MVVFIATTAFRVRTSHDLPHPSGIRPTPEDSGKKVSFAEVVVGASQSVLPGVRVQCRDSLNLNIDKRLHERLSLPVLLPSASRGRRHEKNGGETVTTYADLPVAVHQAQTLDAMTVCRTAVFFTATTVSPRH